MLHSALLLSSVSFYQTYVLVRHVQDMILLRTRVPTQTTNSLVANVEEYGGRIEVVTSDVQTRNLKGGVVVLQGTRLAKGVSVLSFLTDRYCYRLWILCLSTELKDVEQSYLELTAKAMSFKCTS